MRRKAKQQTGEVLPPEVSEQEDHAPAKAARFALATLDALPAHICVLDENGVILVANRAWREYTQAHPPLLSPYPEGTNYLDICDRASGPGSAEAAAFAAGIRAVLRGEVEQFSLEYPCPAPWKEHWFAGLVTRFPAAGPARVVVSYQNITLSKQAEEALSRSENRCRIITELISDYIYSAWLFPDGRVWTEWMAGAFERITGYTLDQVNRLDGGYAALLHPDDRVQVNPTPPVLVANQPSIHEYRIITRSGEVRWLRDYSRPLEAGPEAGSWHILGAVQDITARKQAEAALSEREAQYRAVIETSADGFWIVDLAGRLLEVNDAYIRRSGYSRAELLAMQIGDLDAQESPAGIAARIEQVVRHGSDLFLTRHRTKDGLVWLAEANVSYWPIAGGRLFVFIRDIGQRSRSEALLRTRLHLSELAVQGSLDELMQAALDAAELYTGSQIGFFHFVAPDQENLILQAWSTRTLQVMCQAEGKGWHYPSARPGSGPIVSIPASRSSTTIMPACPIARACRRTILR